MIFDSLFFNLFQIIFCILNLLRIRRLFGICQLLCGFLHSPFTIFNFESLVQQVVGVALAASTLMGFVTQDDAMPVQGLLHQTCNYSKHDNVIRLL